VPKKKTYQPGPRYSRKDKLFAILAIAVTAIIVIGAAAYRFLTPDETIEPARVGEPMADLELQDINGNPVRLSTFAGRPLLINIWATWCAPCKQEMPLLQRYYDAHKGDGFILAAVNAGETAKEVQPFIQENGFTFPTLLDPEEKSLAGLRINNYPTSIFVSPSGIVQKIHIGAFTQTSLEKEITPLLGQ